jgi:ERI1 exoribonuclease 3
MTSWPQYIGVLDFEATCDDVKGYENEIIEFPTILLKWDESAKNYKKISEFQDYCKPLKNTQLTPFCTQLTGILQNKVDSGYNFPESLGRHYRWIKSYVSDDKDIVLLTCGFWDLGDVMIKECKRWDLVPSSIYLSFINIKEEYTKMHKLEKKLGMAGMLKHSQLELVGRHHSGLDDCRNISSILIDMISHGHQMDQSSVRKMPVSLYKINPGKQACRDWKQLKDKRLAFQ